MIQLQAEIIHARLFKLLILTQLIFFYDTRGCALLIAPNDYPKSLHKSSRLRIIFDSALE